MAKPICGRCIFWDSLFVVGEEGPQDDDEGKCRRHPPVVVVLPERVDNYQPLTKREDWCGEYKRDSRQLREE